MAKLSGGEKRRLQLLKVLTGNPNFLILDEPTNDLDLDTLNVLEEFLNDFAGCILLVSHERYFMDRIVDQLFIFQEDKIIRNFHGNYSDYLASEKNTSPETEAKTFQAKPKNESKFTKKLSFKERQELTNLEAEIQQLEEQKTKLMEGLNGSITDHGELARTGEELSRIEQLLQVKSDRWLELSEFES